MYLRLSWVLKSKKDANHQILIKFQQNWLNRVWRTCSENSKFINSVWIKEELPEQWKESVILPFYKKNNETDCRHYRDITFVSYLQNFVQYPSIKVNSIHRKLFGVVTVDLGNEISSATDYMSCILELLEKKMEIKWGGSTTDFRLQECLWCI